MWWIEIHGMLPEHQLALAAFLFWGGVILLIYVIISYANDKMKEEVDNDKDNDKKDL
jgi:arginine exporter protein ArgO